MPKSRRKPKENQQGRSPPCGCIPLLCISPLRISLSGDLNLGSTMLTLYSISAFANPFVSLAHSTVFLSRSTLGQETLLRSFRGRLSKQPSVQNRPFAAPFANMIPRVPFATCKTTPLLTSFIGVLNAAEFSYEGSTFGRAEACIPAIAAIALIPTLKA